MTEEEKIEYKRKRNRDYAKTFAQKEYRKEYMKKWRKNNQEKYSNYIKNRYIKDFKKYKDRCRSWHLKVRYNITTEQYNEMLIFQNNKCFICGKLDSEMKNRLAVDHDHDNGKIRGLLCSKCNASLGWYEKNKDKIELYLEKYNHDKQ